MDHITLFNLVIHQVYYNELHKTVSTWTWALGTVYVSRSVHTYLLCVSEHPGSDGGLWIFPKIF